MKTILITGSSRGIGRAIATKFARNGWRVALNCVHSTDAMDALTAELSQYTDVCGIRADVSDYHAASRLFAEVEERFGTIDVLVNNAGVSQVGLFSETPPEEWERALRMNLCSALNCSHLAIPAMVRQKHGCIINISSVWGVVGASCEAVYSAAKAGLNGFTMALAKELGPSQIRVNAVACGVIDTDMNADLTADEKNALREEIPLGRFGTAEDIANLVHFLASDDAAYITGKVITADGGWI